MNDMTGCLHVRQSLGVYVLGAIDPAERSMVDMHLAGCPDCREELAGLAGLPALLGRVPVAEAEQIAGILPERAGAGDHPDAEHPDSETLTPLLARVAQRRRVSRWRNLAAAAAVALIAAGTAVGAVKIAQTPAQAVASVQWETAQATNPRTQVTADIRYARESWGTRLDAQVSGVKPGTTCEFWVIGAHGERLQAGSWTVTSGWRSPSYQESTALRTSAVTSFEITSGGHTLVHVNAH